MDSLNLDGSSQKTIEQFFNSNVLKLVPAQQVEKKAALIVREVPPVVALFRGFTGNDCSSTYSSTFVKSPNEFVFLVYDSKGQIKGYAQGTKVLEKGKSSFYLHTITGPRMSTKDALLIMQTFATNKMNMGFEQILLPSMTKIKKLVNFAPIHEAFQKVITSTAVQIEYLDAPLRDLITKTLKVTKNYDDPVHSKQGYLLDEELLRENIIIESKLASSFEEIKAQFDRSSFSAMLIKMSKNLTNSKTLIEALAPYVDVPAEKILHWATISENNENLPIQQFINVLSDSMKEYGINFDDNFFKKNYFLIAHGLLNSPDLLKDNNFMEKVIIYLLEQKEIDRVEQFLLKQPEGFQNKKIIVAFFNKYYTDLYDVALRTQEVLRIALKINPQGILRNPEIQNLVLKSRTASTIINQFILDNQKLDHGFSPTIKEKGESCRHVFN